MGFRFDCRIVSASCMIWGHIAWAPAPSRVTAWLIVLIIVDDVSLLGGVNSCLSETVE